MWVLHNPSLRLLVVAEGTSPILYNNPSNYKPKRVYNFSASMPLIVLGLLSLALSLSSNLFGSFYGITGLVLKYCKILPDGPQDTNYGCMAGLTRLAITGKDILIYSNCDSPAGRKQGTVWASFDGGKSWPVKRLVFAGSHAYSSITSGRPGTKSEGMIYHHFEGGPKGGSAVAKFNLSWILGGEKTGDGEVPSWVK